MKSVRHYRVRAARRNPKGAAKLQTGAGGTKYGFDFNGGFVSNSTKPNVPVHGQRIRLTE